MILFAKCFYRIYLHASIRDNKCLKLYIYACSLCDIVMKNCWPTEGVYLLSALYVVLWRIVCVGVSLGRRYSRVILQDAMSIGVGVRRRIGGSHCKFQC